MASLTGQQIKDTYQSLLKTDDNGLITNAFKGVTDGNGSASGLYLRNNGVLLSGSVTISGSLLYSGSTINATVTSASYAENGLSGGTQYYLPVWTGASTLGTSSLYDDGSVLKTISGSSDVGLKLDFANNQYDLKVNDTNGGSGLYQNLDYTNNQYNISLGTGNAGIDGQGLQMQFNNTDAFVRIGDYAQLTNGTIVLVDNNNSIIKTQYGGNDIGLKLDFASSKYELGQLTGGNQTKLTVDDATQTITVTGSLDISGSGRFTNGLTVSRSLYIAGSDPTMFSATGDILEVSGSFVLYGSASISDSVVIDGPVNIKNNTRITGSLNITGSATITNVLTLPYQNPLPSSPSTGSIALSGSGATFVGMFVWTGIWQQI